MKIQTLKIGNVEWRNNVIIAPMSGVSDAPFRRAAWRGGAGMVVCEMVASEALITGQEEMRLKSENAGLPVHVVQLAGREAKWMALAAKMAAENGAHIVDINMGCPARKVTNGLSGSALMRDLDHALGLIEAVVSAVEIPVTLKMRLGWDHASINAPELAKRAQDVGVQLIAVHGRTRCQFYKGKADWRAVRAVRDATELPLIINGDIDGAGSAAKAMEASGADGVMIGRACYGRPDLAGHIVRKSLESDHGQPLEFERYDVVLHYEDMIEFYGEELGVRCARKHVGWWLERLEQAIPSAMRIEMMTTKDAKLVLGHLNSICSLDQAQKEQGRSSDRQAA